MSTSALLKLLILVLTFSLTNLACVTGAQQVPGSFQFNGVSTQCSAAAQFSAYGIETTISLEPSCDFEGSGTTCEVEACVYALGLSKCETLLDD